MVRRAGYNTIQIGLHWAVALLVIFNYLYSDGMGAALDSRLNGSAPEALKLNPDIHVWVGLAEWVHRLLYALMLAAPVLGALTWFGQIDMFGEPHALIANVLMLLAAGHALVAIGHHVFLKDGLLFRMIRPDTK